jgi:hypothetical protein
VKSHVGFLGELNTLMYALFGLLNVNLNAIVIVTWCLCLSPHGAIVIQLVLGCRSSSLCVNKCDLTLAGPGLPRFARRTSIGLLNSGNPQYAPLILEFFTSPRERAPRFNKKIPRIEVLGIT